MSFTEQMKNRIHQRTEERSRLPQSEYAKLSDAAYPKSGNPLLRRHGKEPSPAITADPTARDVNSYGSVTLPEADDFFVNQTLRRTVPSAADPASRSSISPQHSAMIQAVQHYIIYVGDRQPDVDFGAAYSDLEVVANQYDLLVSLGLTGPSMDSVREGLETLTFELENVRIRTEDALAKTSIGPAIEAGFKLSCSPHTHEQQLIKPIPDQDNAYWIIASVAGVNNIISANRDLWSLIAINYDGGGERFTTVGELTDLRTILDNYENLAAPENGGDTSPVILKDWDEAKTASSSPKI